MTEQEARDFCASIKFCGGMERLGAEVRTPLCCFDTLCCDLWLHDVPDRDGKAFPGPSRNTGIVSHWSVAAKNLAAWDKAAFLVELRSTFFAMLLQHEFDESLLYKGKRILDPHAPIDPKIAIERADQEEGEKLRAATTPPNVFADEFLQMTAREVRDPVIEEVLNRILDPAPPKMKMSFMGVDVLPEQSPTNALGEKLRDEHRAWRDYMRDPFGVLPLGKATPPPKTYLDEIRPLDRIRASQRGR